MNLKRNKTLQNFFAKHSWLQKTGIAIIIILVGGIIYSNSFTAPFLFDDHRVISGCSFIQVSNLSLESLKSFFQGLKAQILNRPVTYATFAFNYYFGQYNVFGYHLFNIAIHLINGFLLFLFLQSTLQIHNKRSQYRWSIISPDQIAFFSALLWLVHPLHTQSVTYIVQRMNSMAAMFFLVSMLCYMNGRLRQQEGLCKMKLPASRKRTGLWLTGCIIAGIFAFLSKQNAAVLPFFIILYEWFFFQDLSHRWLLKKALPGAFVFTLLAVLALIFFEINPLDKLTSQYAIHDFTLSQRLLSELRVVVYYLSLLAYPDPNRLNFEYDYPVSNSLSDPLTTLITMIVLTGLIIFTFFSAKRDRLLAFSVLWFLGNLIIESSVFRLDLIYEHRTYLPSMLTSFLFLMLFFQNQNRKWISMIVLCSMMILFSMWTYQRNMVWSDELGFWQDCVSKSPHRARPHNNSAIILDRRGYTHRAIHHYLKALQIYPDLDVTHNSLGNALSKLGRTQDAIDHYLNALRINPDYANAHNNLGNTFFMLGRTKEAITHYHKSLAINPNDERIHYNLSVALFHEGNITESIKHLQIAVKLNPDHTQAKNFLYQIKKK